MESVFLDDKEQAVFSYLHQNGESTVSDIAKGTLINRTSLYPILARMESEGLARSLKTDKVLYSVLTKSELASWVKRKKDDHQASLNRLSEWVDTLEDSSSSLVTEIKYYEGKDGVMNLYDETWRHNSDGIIYALTDYEKAYETMGEFFRKDYFDMRVKKGIKVNSLLPESKIGREDKNKAKQLLRDMRFIKLFENLGIELNVYDDKVLVVAFNDKKPSGVLIKNAVIAKAFKQIFDYLWKSSER